MSVKDGFNSILMAAKRKNNFFVKGFITVAFPRYFFKNIYEKAERKEKFSKIVTLSFDCDYFADIEALPGLIDLLGSYNFRSSFACVGKLIEKYPKEHALIIENDHEIVNHSYTHPPNEELGESRRFDKLSLKEQEKEIVEAHKICKNILDYEPIGFRIPHFAVQYTDKIYNILSNLGYKYSSSILSVNTVSLGAPYLVNNILEFPISTCPKHPFQAFDTYHAFRSKLTSHENEEEFFACFKDLIKFNSERGLYTNLYFDPLDVVKLDNFGSFLDFIENCGLTVETYNNIIYK